MSFPNASSVPSPGLNGRMTPRQRRARAQQQEDSPVQRQQRRSLMMQENIRRMGSQQANLQRSLERNNSSDLAIDGRLQRVSVVDRRSSTSALSVRTVPSQMTLHSPKLPLRSRRRRKILFIVSLLVLVLIVLLVVNPTVTKSSSNSTPTSTLKTNRQMEVVASGTTQPNDVVTLLCDARSMLCGHMKATALSKSVVLIDFDDGVKMLQNEFDAITLILHTPGSIMRSFGIVSLVIRNVDLESVVCVDAYEHLLCGSTRPIAGCGAEGKTGATCNSCLRGFYGPDCSKCQQCPGTQLCQDGKAGDGTCSVCRPGFAGATCSDCAPLRFGASCQRCACGDRGQCNEGKDGDGSCVCESGWAGALCSVCAANHYGASCTACNCPTGAVCNEGIEGDGKCVTRQCSVGEFGPDCQPCPPCINGFCDDGVSGSGICLCNNGFTGTMCDNSANVPSSTAPTTTGAV